MRAWVLGLPFAVLACGRPDGEGWAKDQFGKEGADKLRDEATQKLAGPEGPMMAPPKPDVPTPAYLPRPYVVFDLVADEEDPTRSKLVYAKMNKDRGFDFASASAKAFVVVDYDTVVTGVRKTRRGTRVDSHTEVDLR